MKKKSLENSNFFGLKIAEFNFEHFLVQFQMAMFIFFSPCVSISIGLAVNTFEKPYLIALRNIIFQFENDSRWNFLQN